MKNQKEDFIDKISFLTKIYTPMKEKNILARYEINKKEDLMERNKHYITTFIEKVNKNIGNHKNAKI